MKNKRAFTALFFIVVSFSTFAASPPDSSTVTTKKSIPILSCFQRPKFLEINFRTLPSINAYPGEYLSGNEKFETNYLIDAKLSLPIVLKDNFKLFTQIRYKNEALNLGENDYYEKEINLKNTGITFIYQWFYQDNKYIGGHISGALKADQYNFRYYSSILDYNTSFVYGEKKGAKNLAIGVILGNSLGRFRVSPLIIYENKLANSWFLSVHLPKRITITKAIIPDNFYLYGSLEAIGASYFLKNSPDGFENIEYRRSAIDLKIGLEKEIKDWMWVGIETGISQPLYSVFVNPGNATRSRVHDFKHQFSPFVNLSIFAVPPRALYSRMK